MTRARKVEGWEEHLLDETDLLPGPGADVGGDSLRHEVELVGVQARVVLLVVDGQAEQVVSVGVGARRSGDSRHNCDAVLRLRRIPSALVLACDSASRISRELVLSGAANMRFSAEILRSCCTDVHVTAPDISCVSNVTQVDMPITVDVTGHRRSSLRETYATVWPRRVLTSDIARLDGGEHRSAVPVLRLHVARQLHELAAVVRVHARAEISSVIAALLEVAPHPEFTPAAGQG